MCVQNWLRATYLSQMTQRWPAGHGLNITVLYHFSPVATLNSTDGSVTVDSKMV